MRDEADFTLSSKFIEDINIDRKLKPIPLEVEKNYDYDTWHWSFNFIIAGLFGAFSYIITIYGTVLFRPFHIFLIIIGSCSVIAGFYKYFYKKVSTCFVIS
ncbi:MAG: hypothetical protein IPP71_08685 [Bacteroidetes bacterium]|nr:hypothetical protein [Bacteroidota bacterium]